MFLCFLVPRGSYVLRGTYFLSNNYIIMLNDILQSTSAALDSIGQATSNVATVNGKRKARELQYKMFQEANVYNSVEADKARQWALEQWQRENAYNDPSAVKQRLLNAGINPLLLDGQWSSSNSTPSAPSASSAGVPSIESPIVSNPFSSVSQDLVNIATAKKIESENTSVNLDNQQVQDMLRSGMNPKEIGAYLTMQQYLNAKTEGSFMPQQIQASLRQSDAVTQNTKAVEALNRANEKLVQKNVDSFDTRLDLDIKHNSAVVNELESKVRANNEQVQLMKSQESLNAAEEEEKQKTISNLEEQNKVLTVKSLLSKYGIFDTDKNPVGTKIAVMVAEGQLDPQDADRLFKEVGKMQLGILKVGEDIGMTAETAALFNTIEATKIEMMPTYNLVRGLHWTRSNPAGSSVTVNEDGTRTLNIQEDNMNMRNTGPLLPHIDE